MSLLRIEMAAATLFVSLLPAVASAHAFGQQYTLPIPFGFYALGGALALIASFALFLLLPRMSARSSEYGTALFSVPRAVPVALRVLGVVMLVSGVVAGFVGPQETTANLAPEFMWVILLLGVAYMNAIVGGVWSFLNPFEWIARLVLGSSYRPLYRYPQWLGVYPAVIAYAYLLTLELLSFGLGAVPSVVALVLCAYLFISVAGSALFGADAWFTQADFLNMFFGVFARSAPVQLSTSGEVSYTGLSRSVELMPRRLGEVLFILLMLSSTAYDGLKETQVWQAAFFPLKVVVANYAFFEHILLYFSPFIFAAFYVIAIYAMRLLTRSAHRLEYLLRRFAFSLAPIAVAYGFAHYFTLLLNGVQHVYALLSDPFGRGWDVFGTAAYQVHIGLMSARTVWEIQLSVIIIGHIVATYIAHRIAEREFEGKRALLLGQLPMLGLMVAYTVFGLWILSLAYALP